jgi:hypothetical protein
MQIAVEAAVVTEGESMFIISYPEVPALFSRARDLASPRIIAFKTPYAVSARTKHKPQCGPREIPRPAENHRIFGMTGKP